MAFLMDVYFVGVEYLLSFPENVSAQISSVDSFLTDVILVGEPLPEIIHSDDRATARSVQIHIVDELVKIVKPVIRVLIVEIRATGPHLVVCACVVLEVHGGRDEFVQPLVEVIIMSPWVVLNLIVRIIEVYQVRRTFLPHGYQNGSTKSN
jgi:hypothetical protein